MGTICSIVYQPLNKKYSEYTVDFSRDPLRQAVLVANHGIEGDAKAGRNRKRQLNILSLEWLDGSRANGYGTQIGEFGEKIIVQDLPVEDLLPGDRLQLGSSAMIEITVARTGCIRLAAAQGISKIFLAVW